MFSKFNQKLGHFFSVLSSNTNQIKNETIVVNGNKLSRDVLNKVKTRHNFITIQSEHQINKTSQVNYISIKNKLDVDIREPKLAIILVGNAADSISYVNAKEKACKRVGVVSELIHLPEQTTQDEVLKILRELNKRDDVDSILTQLPFPPHISKTKVISNIIPEKDVDGLQKCFMTSQLIWDDKNNQPLPCTPQSCLHILESHNIDVKGKVVVMLGKGLLVGAPLSALLLGRGAIVRMCDKNSDITSALKEADILVSATGVRQLVKGEYLKPGVVVIDVGCSRPLPHEDQTSVVGDVEFESAKQKASLITPVPGGVGPVTVSMLIQSVVTQWIRNHQEIIEKIKMEDNITQLTNKQPNIIKQNDIINTIESFPEQNEQNIQQDELKTTAQLQTQPIHNAQLQLQQ